MAITLKEAIKIAKVHAENIQETIESLAHYFPITSEKVGKMSKEEFRTFAGFLSYFSILQEIIGSKLFPLLLEETIAESVDNMTFIDRLNKLEKLEIVEDAEEWKNIRKVRNRIAHHYPDKLDEMAELFNDVYNMTPKLLDCLERIHKMAERL